MRLSLSLIACLRAIARNAMKEKAVCAICALLVCWAVASGCSQKTTWRGVEEIKKSGVIRVAVYEDRYPFCYMDSAGQYQGFTVNLWRRMASDLGVEAHFVLVESGERISALMAGAIDAADIEYSASNTAQAAFGDPYMKLPLGVVSRTADAVSNVADLYGKKLIVINDTHAEVFFTFHYPDITLLKTDSLSSAEAALLDGRGDAMAGDGFALFGFAHDNPDYEVSLESLGEIDALSLAVHKDNTDLLVWLNVEMQKLMAEGFFYDDYDDTMEPVYGEAGQPERLFIHDGEFEPISHPHPMDEEPEFDQVAKPHHWRTIEEIKEAGEIRFAMFEDNPPFTYEDKDGVFQGCNVYFARRLAQDLKVEIKFLHVDFVHQLEDLERDLFDVIISNFTMTDELSDKIAYSMPYMKLPLSVMSPEDAVISDVAELAGKKVIVVKKSMADIYFSEHHPEIELLKCEQFSAMFSALQDDRGVAVAGDYFSLKAWMASNPGYTIAIKSLGEPRLVTVAVHKENRSLLSWINGEMVEIGKERFFHHDFEDTLQQFCGPTITADMLVIEGGRL